MKRKSVAERHEIKKLLAGHHILNDAAYTPYKKSSFMRMLVSILLYVLLPLVQTS